MILKFVKHEIINKKKHGKIKMDIHIELDIQTALSNNIY